jgi:hypothetical protein
MAIWQQVPGQNNQSQRVAIDTGYRYGNISFQKELAGNWNLTGGISYSGNRDDMELDQTEIRRTNQLVHTKWVADKFFRLVFQ